MSSLAVIVLRVCACVWGVCGLDMCVCVCVVWDKRAGGYIYDSIASFTIETGGQKIMRCNQPAAWWCNSCHSVKMLWNPSTHVWLWDVVCGSVKGLCGRVGVCVCVWVRIGVTIQAASLAQITSAALLVLMPKINISGSLVLLLD